MIWNKNKWNRRVSLRNVKTCTTKVYNEYPSQDNLFVIIICHQVLPEEQAGTGTHYLTFRCLPKKNSFEKNFWERIKDVPNKFSKYLSGRRKILST